MIRRRCLDSLALARYIVNVVEDKKAEDIILLDMRPEAVLADFFMICTGNSDRQLRALVENIREAVKTEFGILPHSVEGTPESGWVLVDYSHVIIHAFMQEKRRYYDLEGLWRAESKVMLSIQ